MSATIVQFSAVLTTPDAARLRAEYDLKLDRYIPEQGYLERLSPATVDRVRSDFLVRSCTPLDPTLKLSPSIQQAAPGSPAGFNAILFDDAGSAQVKAALETAGAEDVTVDDDRDFGGQLGLTFLLDDLARLDEIAALEEIVWLEPVWPIAIQSTENVEAAETLQSGILGQSPVWDKELHGEGQVIGVIDKGSLSIDHCFFADAAPNKPGPNHRKVLAIFNESGVAAEPGQEDHPYQVCGIAAGDQFGNSGANVNRGSAWNAKLVYTNVNDMLKKYRSFPSSKYRSFHYLLNQAKEAGAVIHSCSWVNSEGGSYDTRAREVEAFTWANEDHLVVAGGANNVNTPRINTPPGTAKNGLCVAAAKAFPDHMSRGRGVSGPTADGRRKPEIMAIGGELELVASNTPCGTVTVPGFHCSNATPHAAAAAALVRQYFVDGFYPFGERNPSFGFVPTGALLKAVLLNSTVDMTGEPGYPSDTEGWGLIRLSNTLFFKGGKRRLAVKDVRRATGLDVGDSLSAYDSRRTHKIIVNDSAEQLKITLVWTDPPPSDFKSPSVNSLKLEAAAEEGLGETYVGNDIDTATGLSRPDDLSRALDTKNNVHMIIVNNPPVGPWIITVSTKSIWVGDKPYRQGYALVASGGIDQYGFLVGPIA